MSKPTSRRPLPISIGGKVVVEGPLVVPSYSSKALARISVDTAVDETADFIVSPILVSAYDIRHHGVDPARFRVPLIIVDSGGYETLVDEEGRRRGGNADHAMFDWSAHLYAETLQSIETEIPLVVVSYDRVDLPVDEQIDAALAARLPEMGSAFLLKPRRGEALSIESIRDHARKLAGFDIVGVTEKEAGATLMDRLSFVVRLRALFDECGVGKPIHVFGALDPLMTPLFFLAGADIVDGLTWLRFDFSDEGARYLQSRAAIADPTAIISDAEWNIRRLNYRRAVDMQIAFERYLRSGDLTDLSNDPAFLDVAAEIHQVIQAAMNTSD
jgi:hypothetical protein